MLNCSRHADQQDRSFCHHKYCMWVDQRILCEMQIGTDSDHCWRRGGYCLLGMQVPVQTTTDASGMWLVNRMGSQYGVAWWLCVPLSPFLYKFLVSRLLLYSCHKTVLGWLLQCLFARIDCILWWSMSVEVIWCFAFSKKENSKNQWQCEFVNNICWPFCVIFRCYLQGLVTKIMLWCFLSVCYWVCCLQLMHQLDHWCFAYVTCDCNSALHFCTVDSILLKLLLAYCTFTAKVLFSGTFF